MARAFHKRAVSGSLLAYQNTPWLIFHDQAFEVFPKLCSEMPGLDLSYFSASEGVFTPVAGLFSCDVIGYQEGHAVVAIRSANIIGRLAKSDCERAIDLLKYRTAIAMTDADPTLLPIACVILTACRRATSENSWAAGSFSDPRAQLETLETLLNRPDTSSHLELIERMCTSIISSIRLALQWGDIAYDDMIIDLLVRTQSGMEKRTLADTTPKAIAQ